MVNEADVAFTELLLDVESSVLRYFLKNGVPDSQNIKAARQSVTFSKTHIEERLQLYRETSTLLRYDGRTCNPNWSNKRLKREHDKAVGDQMAQRVAAADDTRFCADFKLRSKSKLLSAARLCNNKQYVKEATEQRHCVTIYSDAAKEGSYAVFKIEGQERATLGVNIKRFSNGHHICLFDQVTTRFNAVACEATRAFCDEIIEAFTTFLNDNAALTAQTKERACA